MILWDEPMEAEPSQQRGRLDPLRRLTRALAAATRWMATLRAINKIYQEVSLEELSATMRRTTSPEETATNGGKGDAAKGDGEAPAEPPGNATPR